MITDSVRGIDQIETIRADGLRIGIVAARWNPTICDALVEGCKNQLETRGATVFVERVGGAYELPLAASVMLNAFDAVVCIGCLIKGETMHFEYICEAVSQGIMRLNLDFAKPVTYGVLTVLNEDQAKQRAGLLPGHSNCGPEWADTCIESVLLVRKYGDGAQKQPIKALKD